ncbi:methionine-10+ [Methanomicrobiaceae archaeon CYW5]|uniref:class I SAM-dependent methyltransferase n=1 Tax=Methanovulcanius yangii TaxID=1789227 RepID=UPI0029C9F205|nr:RsmD family RNA methyltransferase [Methanovulcanius yangii]MBT8508343.1 methionine-10+ [Methanovulcanius yangii]
MTLKECLAGTLPDGVLSCIPDHFDVIGDVAIVSLPPEAAAYAGDIAAAVQAVRHNIATVLNKTSRLEGDHRVCDYEVITGDRTETLHREYGCTYRLDVREVFFNPRLASERRRVTGQVRESEEVLIPFAGIGPFVIPAAAAGGRVTAIEKNPAACHWLCENVAANNLAGQVTIIEDDAFQALPMLTAAFDRVIVPTPYGMDLILDEVIPLVRRGGIIHFYTFRATNEIDILEARFRNMGMTVRKVTRCGNVAPGIARWAFDMRRR